MYTHKVLVSHREKQGRTLCLFQILRCKHVCMPRVYFTLSHTLPSNIRDNSPRDRSRAATLFAAHGPVLWVFKYLSRSLITF